MKKHNDPTDDFWREALKNHRMAPSEAAKKAFLKDVTQLVPPKKDGRMGLILLSGLLLLVGAGIIIWAISSRTVTSTPARGSNVPMENTHPASRQAVATTDKEPGNNIRQCNPVASASSKTTQHPIHPTSGQKSQKLPASSQSITLTYKVSPQSKKTMPTPVTGSLDKRTQDFTSSNPDLSSQTNKNATLPNPTTSSTPAVSNVNSADISSPGGIKQVTNEGKNAVAIQSPAPSNSSGRDTGSASIRKKPDSIPVPASGAPKRTRDASGRRSIWIPSIGVYYSPEWMFNTIEGTKFVNNFGVEGIFHFGKFSIRTGAGLSVAKGTNELVVAYNDFLGAYNKLDSIDFTWNEPAHKYIPTMYLSRKDVWDSLMKHDYPKVVKRYTYLQIPMIMGYDFWQADRISMGMRAGPVMSIMVSSKQLSAAYDPGTKLIISINDIAPEQVSLNWQVMAGLNTVFLLTKSLQFEVEPSARYYFNSVYEKPVNNAKPWSIGIRAALVVKL